MLVCVIIATQSKIENEMENMSQDLTLIHGIGTYLTFGTGFQLQLLLLLYITCPPMFVMCSTVPGGIVASGKPSSPIPRTAATLLQRCEAWDLTADGNKQTGSDTL